MQLFLKQTSECLAQLALQAMHDSGLLTPVYYIAQTTVILEDRRTLAPFQRQANHSNFKIIGSQLRALFCIDHDPVKWHAKVFSSHYKAYFGKNFHIFII